MAFCAEVWPFFSFAAANSFLGVQPSTEFVNSSPKAYTKALSVVGKRMMRKKGTASLAMGVMQWILR